jgi:hypothetical protein
VRSECRFSGIYLFGGISKNPFTLFTGSGLGSLLFAGSLRLGLEAALVLFGAMAVLMAAAAVPVFRGEIPHRAPAAHG